MLELTSTKDEMDHLQSSPLMMTDEQQMTQDVQQKSDADDAADSENDQEYGTDPLSVDDDSQPLTPQPAFPQQQQQQQHHNPPSSKSTIRRKLVLLLPLLLCLYMLTDTNFYTMNEQPIKRRHHLAFVTALSRHPPSLRVFRIVSEGAFLLLCAAFALWVWEGAATTTVLLCNNAAISLEGGEEEESSSLERDWDNVVPTNIIQINPQAVGKLLFAPPPNSITSNAAWVVLQQRHRSFRRRRRKRSRSSMVEYDGDCPGENNGESSELRTIDMNNNANIIQTTTEGEDDHDMVTAQQSQQLPHPPYSVSVLGAALDVMTLMCMLLIFFTISSAEGGRYIDQRPKVAIVGGATKNEESWMKYIANIAAPLFPLTLFIIAILMVSIPWRKRKVIWTIVSLTVGAPFYEVTFRDGFIGDILTSTVRPLQDLAFTVFFLPLGLKAWWSQQLYTMDAAAIPLERSWLLHTVVLPACTLSPLWWRFLQNLRQCYDSKQRWPYLGNALKYLLAAEVAVFGVFDPTVKTSPLWLTCFFSATLYQVWWDVFMDWGLLERDPSFGYYHGTTRNNGGRRWLWWWPYSLRSQRLYQRKWVYLVIFGINFCLRFVGMLTLIPPVYLSRTTGLIVNTYNDPDFQLFVGSLIALAEIFRRTIWALLRLEWEVIKTSSESRKNEVRPLGNNNRLDNLLEEEEEMKPMAIGSSEMNGRYRPWPFATKENISLASLNDMSNLNDIQILSELCVWATIFSGIAIIAAAHREVL